MKFFFFFFPRVQGARTSDRISAWRKRIRKERNPEKIKFQTRARCSKRILDTLVGMEKFQPKLHKTHRLGFRCTHCYSFCG